MDELDSFVNYLEKQYSVDDNRLQSEMQTLKRKLNVKVKTRKNVLSALCVRNYILEKIH